ncbi:MAG: FkbM family methyltransferase [Lachnospiraceae bacterium]|nr:FkbM family methyltransferase [Lachnospiraceae bacterium]
MKKINTAKTRILIFETLKPAYQDLFASVNEDYFEIAAIIDNESAVTHSADIPVVSFTEIVDFSFWDLLVVNDEVFHEDILEILSMLHIPKERYVFLSKSIQPEEFGFYRAFFSAGSSNGKLLDFFLVKRGQNYLTVATEGGDYITHASDYAISANMFLRKQTYSQREIDLFILLAKQYYGTTQNESAFFFDIGANIGTTCIYVKKCLLPNISIAAFEPIYKNYKLLLANFILNDITDYVAVNKAVSDASASYKMRFEAGNPGGSSIVSGEEAMEASDLQSVDSLSVDEFLMQNHIEPANVRYVWIDTEGFEANVLKGAKLLLEQEKTAFYMEYAPYLTDVKQLTIVADICSRYFRQFICTDDFLSGDTQPRPIEDLYELYKRCPDGTNVFLIK